MLDKPGATPGMPMMGGMMRKFTLIRNHRSSSDIYFLLLSRKHWCYQSYRCYVSDE
jgi:hypothetical protein